MSSHHIVRDAQEPALLIAEADIPAEIVGQLLEWSPVVVVLEHCLEKVLAWNIKIEKVICSEIHRKKVWELTAHQQPLQILVVKEENMKVQVDFAISHLIAQGHSALSLLLPTFSPSDFVQYLDKIALIFFEMDWKGYFVPQGIFKKWVTAGTLFQVENEHIITQLVGLEKVENNMFRVSASGLISLEVIQTTFLREQMI
jgi:thiamine pyrophosphokinase